MKFNLKNKKTIYNIAALAVAILIIGFLQINSYKYNYQIGILERTAIYAVVAISMNLLNGFTGLFSLGQAGFMAIGAYTVGKIGRAHV